MTPQKPMTLSEYLLLQRMGEKTISVKTKAAIRHCLNHALITNPWTLK